MRNSVLSKIVMPRINFSTQSRSLCRSRTTRPPALLLCGAPRESRCGEVGCFLNVIDLELIRGRAVAFADLMTWIEWPACQMLFCSYAVNTVESFSALHFTSGVRINVARNEFLCVVESGACETSKCLDFYGKNEY